LPRRFAGAVQGFLRFPDGIALHESPPETWLNLGKEAVRRPGHGTQSGIPQVLFNEARSSRGPWRLKGLIDAEGHPVAGRFNVVRPRTGEPVEFLWALLNSPIANAFAFTHSGNRHNDAGMMRQMPVPATDDASIQRVCEAARNYLDYVSPKDAYLHPAVNPETVRELVLRMDNAVLRLYLLPRELEWELLSLFAGWSRGGLPFRFDRYFPEHFTDRISLADHLAITYDWSETNRRRESLIRKKMGRLITQFEQAELDHLQSLASSRVRLFAPLPLKELDEVHRQLVGSLAE
jgi:hypothetical protein